MDVLGENVSRSSFSSIGERWERMQEEMRERMREKEFLVHEPLHEFNKIPKSPYISLLKLTVF